MMQNWIKAGSILLLLTGSITSNAQQKPDTTIKSTTIEILQSYKPEVKKAPKPVFPAELPKVPAATEVQQYDVPDYPLSYTYPTQPLIPLKMPNDTAASVPFPNYVKAGLGNLKTYLLDVGIGSLQGENYQSAFHAYHLSQDGNNLRQQKVAKSGVDAQGKLQTATKTWSANIEALRHRMFYYGYDQKLDTLPAGLIQQTYTGLEVGMGMQHKPQDSSGWQYGIHASFYAFSNAGRSKERQLHVRVPLRKAITESVEFIADADLRFTTLQHQRTINNNLLALGAGLHFHREAVSFKAMLRPAVGQGSQWYLLPELRLFYHPQQSLFRGEVGVYSEVLQNTFRSIATENPFVGDSLNTLQTSATHIYMRLSTTLLEHLYLSGKFSYDRYKMLPMFVNNVAKPREFTLLYDSAVQGYHFNIAAHYQFAEKFQLGINNDFYTFTKKTHQKIWHQPAYVLRADFSYHPIKELNISAYGSILNQIFTPDATVVSGYAKVPGVFDIGLGAEYALVERVHLFINVNNITNRKNERWYGYQQYGTNVFGGVRVRF